MDPTSKRTGGEWSFLIGVFLAAVLAFFPNLLETGVSSTILIVLGFIVGFLNISRKEKLLFLAGALVLLVVGAGGLETLPKIGGAIGNFTANLSAFVSPAASIVALKAIVEAGQTSI